MKALILKASDSDYRKIKEINNINDLLKIYNSLIIDYSIDTLEIYKKYNIDIVVTIYDWWVE